jgi:hypothetical protein
MKSYSSYFVRTADSEKAAKVFGKVETVPNSDWLMCGYSPDDSPPDDAVLLGEESLTTTKSEQLGEVIFVYGDTSCDGFVYEHAFDGKLLRKLVWFPMLDDDWTAGWLCVEGDSESWEEALFSPHQLAICLENERYKLEEQGRADDATEMEAEIKQFWADKQMAAQKTYPSCDGTVALLVEKSYGINRMI